MSHNKDGSAFSDQLHAARQQTGSTFSGYLLPQSPTEQDLLAAVNDYEIICAANICAVLERFERHAGSYPFVDTKLDLQTGQDFDPADIVRGRDTIYGWIQGRGLESLAGHAQWADGHANEDIASLSPRLRGMEAIVLDSVQRLRATNAGHLFFFMKPDGVPFVLAADGGHADLPQDSSTQSASTPSGYSDLFGAKGLFAAARDLGNTAVEAEARAWYERTGLAVFPYSSLARGFFSGRLKSSDRAGFEEIVDAPCQRAYCFEVNFQRLERVEELAAETGYTVAQIALAYVVHQPMHIHPLVGAAKRAEIESCIAALDLEFSQSTLDWLDLRTETR